MPAALLGQEKSEEAPAIKEYDSGFLVLTDDAGNFYLEMDINAPVTTKRQATGSEVKGALSTILMDMQTQETAILASDLMIAKQMNMARQAYEQQQSQAILQQVTRGGK